MKIGVDARNLVPNLSGIGRYVLEMCKALSDRGHTLLLYLPEQPFHMLPVLHNTEIKVWNYQGPLRRAWWGNSCLPKAAADDNLDLFWGPAHRLPIGLNNTLPCVLTIHDLVWQHASHTMRWQTWMGEALFMKSSVSRADHIITISEATKRDLIESYPDAKNKTTVIYPGVSGFPDSSIEDETNLRQWGIDRPFALFVGTLEPRKNLKRLISAFAALPTPIKEQLMLVVAGGKGWQLNDLAQIIEENGLLRNVAITGFVTDAQLARLYASSKFLIMPSIYEGFGLPIIEAQSYGKAVITSNISSMPEIAGGGAMLIDPLSISELTSAIQALDTDIILRRALERQSRENATRFTWQKSGENICELFYELCSGHNKNSRL